MINELDRVVLTVEISEYGLTIGDVGTVVMVHQDNNNFEVEFITLDGETLAVTSLYASQIRSIMHREIANARLLAA